MNAKWKRTTLATAPHEWRRTWHRGWLDAQNAPERWPRDYDRMSPTEQLGYEQGRLHLRNVLAARLPVPAWDGRKSTCGAVEDAMYRALRVVGWPL